MNNYVKRWEAEASKTRYLRSAQCPSPKNKGSVVILSTFRHETNTSIGLAAATPNFYPSKLSCSAPTSIPNGGTYSAGHYTSHSSWKNDNFAILTSSHETDLPALESSRPQMRLHAQEVQEANAAVVQDMDPESNWTFSYPRAADDGGLFHLLVCRRPQLIVQQFCTVHLKGMSPSLKKQSPRWNTNPARKFKPAAKMKYLLPLYLSRHLQTRMLKAPHQPQK
jgi:hypothetical protein